MIHCLSRWLALLLLSLLSMTAMAVPNTDKTVHIVTEVWPDFANADGTGVYLELAKRIFEPEGYTINVRYVPFKRALFHLENQLDDAMFGIYASPSDEAPYLYTPQQPISDERVVAVFLVSSPIEWRGPETLTGKRVAMVRGYGYDTLLGQKFTLFETSSVGQGFSMLNLQRVNLVLDVAVDVAQHLQDTQSDPQRYRIETVQSKPTYMAFTNTERGQRLATIFDERMRKLIATGEAQAIYAKWGAAFPEAGNAE